MANTVFLLAACLMGQSATSALEGSSVKRELSVSPSHLYKILSVANWEKSLDLPEVFLSEDDASFIHLATEEQLERILKKYWSHESAYVVLKVVPGLLKGDLVFEANPGGTAQYYHLYQGSIPKEAIVESKLVITHS